MDLQKPLIPIIQILGHNQSVEYEGLHQICFECGKYGHRIESCPKFTFPLALVEQGAQTAKWLGEEPSGSYLWAMDAS